jgi:hypothetical protein
MTSNIKRYDILQSCVALRSMLVQLDGGTKVTIIPGSMKHRQLEAACRLLEIHLLSQTSHAQPTTGAKRRPASKIKPRSLVVRKSREKLRKEVNDLIDKYFKVHGKPKAVVAVKNARKLLAEPNFIIET